MHAPITDRPTSTQLVLLFAITATIASVLAFPAPAQRGTRYLEHRRHFAFWRQTFSRFNESADHPRLHSAHQVLSQVFELYRSKLR